MPCSSRYQLWQPVTQTVPGSAPRSSSLKRAVASAVGAIVATLPCRQSSIQRITYLACVSATAISETLPTGLWGPSSMKKFGKPGTATVR